MSPTSAQKDPPLKTPDPAPGIREDSSSGSGGFAPSGNTMPLFADFDAEKAVLASLLAEPETIQTALTILGGIQPSADTGKKKKKNREPSASYFKQIASLLFRDPKHALIYEAILEIHTKHSCADLLTVADQLQKTGRLAILGGMDYLISLQSSIASTANMEGWCRILRDYAMLREIVRTCTDALDTCRDPDLDVRTTLDTIENSLFNVHNNFNLLDVKSFRELLSDAFTFFSDVIQHKCETGIMTGFAGLDRLTGGLRKQEMFVLAARPSIGKTALALNIVRNIIMKNVSGVPPKNVAYFSLEMSAEQIAQRLLCTESEIPLSDIMSRRLQKSGIKRLMDAAGSLSKAKLSIDPTGGLSVFELRAKARKLKETSGLDLIVIDYLTLMRAEVKASDGRQVEVAAISGGLKKLAKDLNVPVLVLAQLNREVEKGPQGGKTSRPKLSHLRDSGAIEQDADIVVFLHRDRDETKDASEEANREGVQAELIVEKNRNGATGREELLFFPKLMLFRSVEHKYKESDTSL